MKQIVTFLQAKPGNGFAFFLSVTCEKIYREILFL